MCDASDDGNFYRYIIGPLSPLNFVIYYRCRPNVNLPSTTAPDGGYRHSDDDDIGIFRSTDLDQFQYRLDGVTGEARVTATNLCNTRKIVIYIKSLMPVYDVGFRIPIRIPTAQGFSNLPGCKETYTGMCVYICTCNVLMYGHTSFITYTLGRYILVV